MDRIGRPATRAVVYIGCSQGGGKTEILLNASGYFVVVDPAPQIFVTDTIKKAEDTSKERWSKMVSDTPSLRALVAGPKSRTSGNTILHKSYPGGALDFVGANAPGDLASRPKRVLLVDEVDRFGESAGTEGDPLSIVQQRLSSYWNSVEIYATSPGRPRINASWALWKKTDQAEWLVPCPDCAHWQQLRWANVDFGEKDEHGAYRPEAARYACEQCGSLWSDLQRWNASRKGDFRSTATATEPGWFGYRLSALAVIGKELAGLIRKFLAAQGNPHKLQVFTNTDLCEWWEDPSAEGIDDNTLRQRAEDWTSWKRGGVEVPANVAVLTTGIDVQGNRIEYEVVGWARGEESYSIQYGVIPGDLRSDPNVLAQLDRILLRPWRHAKGFDLYIRGGCMDAGYAAQNVVAFTKDRLSRIRPDGYSSFLFATIGRSQRGSVVWPPFEQKVSKVGKKLVWVVNVDAAKDQIYGRFALEPKPAGEPNPGYCHFPRGREKAYFEQLAAERSVPKLRSGVRTRAWEPIAKGVANEALDTRVYAYAALCALESKPFSMVLDHEVDRVEALPFMEPTDPPPEAPAMTQRHMPRRGGRGVRSRGIR